MIAGRVTRWRNHRKLRTAIRRWRAQATADGIPATRQAELLIIAVRSLVPSPEGKSGA